LNIFKNKSIILQRKKLITYLSFKGSLFQLSNCIKQFVQGFNIKSRTIWGWLSESHRIGLEIFIGFSTKRKIPFKCFKFRILEPLLESHALVW